MCDLPFSALLGSVTTVDQLKEAITLIHKNILNSKPKERAVAVAQEIKREHPDIIALQEAWIMRTGPAGAPATRVESDQLEDLLNELHQQLPLFATGLGDLGLLGWCRKRKAAPSNAT